MICFSVFLRSLRSEKVGAVCMKEARGRYLMRRCADILGQNSYAVGIYSRLSVEHPDQRSESVENQIALIKQFIRDHNEAPDRKMEFIIYDIYTDRGISGTTFVRSGFERLMRDVREHRVNCIIVKDLSRLGRDYLETGQLIEKLLPLLGCRLIAVADQFDSMESGADDSRLMLHMKNLVNDMYARDISKRVIAARKMAAESGAFTGSFAPYGYEIIRTQGIRQLHRKEECAAVVRKIFTLYAQGAAINEIIAELYAERVHRISDYKKYGHVHCKATEELHQWSSGTIWGMLQNTNYLGDTHEAVVSRRLFDCVQERMAESGRRLKSRYESKGTENVFRTLLYCGCCGKRMHAVCYQSHVSGERHYAYVCRNAYLIDGRKCEKNHIREKQLRKICTGQLRRTLREQHIGMEELTDMLLSAYAEKMAGYERTKKQLLGACTYRKKQAGSLYERCQAGMITRAEYAAFRQRKKEQDALAEKSLQSLQEKEQKLKHRAEAEEWLLRSFFQADQCGWLPIRFAEAMIDKIYLFPDGRIDLLFRFQRGEGRLE